MLDISNSTGLLRMGINASMDGGRAFVLQEYENNNRYLYPYGTGLRFKVKKKPNGQNSECHGLIIALKKCSDSVYGVRILTEPDVNTLVH